MTTTEAKECYEVFHDAMGNWSRVPFEHLTAREMEAWQKTSGHASELERQLEDAQQDCRDMRSELREAEEKQAEAEEDLAVALRERLFLADQIKKQLGFCPFNVGECR